MTAMLNRLLGLILLLLVLTSSGCRDRWRQTTRGVGFGPPRGVGYARSRGYNACVDSPDVYLPMPEEMLRAESRELRGWYREFNVSGHRRQYNRGRTRGRLARGVHGPQQAYGGYYGDGDYDPCGQCGGCSQCCDCELGYGGMDCGGMPVDLGCNSPFPVMSDDWSGYPQTAICAYPGDNSSHSCPVCGHAGPVYQIDPGQMVPHQGPELQNQYLPPLQQVPPAPTYSGPPIEPPTSSNPTPSTAPAPPPAVPNPPLDDMVPATVPEPMPSPIGQIYFAPPIRR